MATEGSISRFWIPDYQDFRLHVSVLANYMLFKTMHPLTVYPFAVKFDFQLTYV
jgi:hypothetical protein